MASRSFLGLLIVVSVVGVIVSFAAWAFLELVYQIQQKLYVHLPHAVGYPHGPPERWSLPILAVAGIIVATPITRLPGEGGHVPALGLAAGKPTTPRELPGGLLAAHLPGFAVTPAVAVGMGAAVAAVLKLPLSAVVTRHFSRRRRGPAKSR